jgi:DNA-binding response OmpR family regulator
VPSDAKNILIVDDDESLMRFLRLFLEMEGVGEVKGVTDGAAALEVVEDFRPDIAVVDYWMPPVHGNEIAQRLREKVPGVIIVAFSGLLEERPDWADFLFMKSELFDIASLKEMLARTGREGSGES